MTEKSCTNLTTEKSCTNLTPPWFTGRWSDWHRGHGCDRDDGRPRSIDATAEIARHEANTRFLTDTARRASKKTGAK